MNVKQVLEEYSTLTLDPKLKEECIKELYEGSMKFLPSFIERVELWKKNHGLEEIIKTDSWKWQSQSKIIGDKKEFYYNIKLVRANLILQEFLECFPRRGLVLSQSDFGLYLKKFAQQYDNLAFTNGISGELRKGKGFNKFMNFIETKESVYLNQINMLQSDELFTGFITVNYLLCYKNPGNEPTRTPRYRIIFQKFKSLSEISRGGRIETKYKFTEWDWGLTRWPSLTSELPLGKFENVDVSFLCLTPTNILSVVVGNNYAIPFQICSFGVLIYGIFDLVHGNWLQNPMYEDFRNSNKVSVMHVNYSSPNLTERKRRFWNTGTCDPGPM